MLSTILWRRQPLTVLSTLTIAGLLLSTLAFGLLQLLIGEVITAIAIVMGCLILVSALIAVGWRWTPLLGAILGVGTAIGGQSYTLFHLIHPEDFGFFSAIVLVLTGSLIALVGGVGATFQNYRENRSTPRWFASGLSALSGVVVGALLVSSLVTSTTQANTTSQGTVHMGPGMFVQSSVVVTKGSKLRLIDDGAFLHILENGSWENNTPKTVQEPGAPAVSNIQANGNTVEIGPFNIAGTYHIYCTVHTGMNLTIIVQ